MRSSFMLETKWMINFIPRLLFTLGLIAQHTKVSAMNMVEILKTITLLGKCNKLMRYMVLYSELKVPLLGQGNAEHLT